MVPLGDHASSKTGLEANTSTSNFQFLPMLTRLTLIFFTLSNLLEGGL